MHIFSLVITKPGLFVSDLIRGQEVLRVNFIPPAFLHYTDERSPAFNRFQQEVYKHKFNRNKIFYEAQISSWEATWDFATCLDWSLDWSNMKSNGNQHFNNNMDLSCYTTKQIQQKSCMNLKHPVLYFILGNIKSRVWYQHYSMYSTHKAVWLRMVI